MPSDDICLDDGQPAVPRGFFAISNDDSSTGRPNCALINMEDVLNTRYHPDARRHQGCCGRDGCDGPNLLCANGHEVGTERSDCWMSHAVALPIAVVNAAGLADV
jgi:hypothetical protein